jgi:hypothetical protein
MIQALIILGWLVALGCFVFLVADSLTRRFPRLRRRSSAAEKGERKGRFLKWRRRVEVAQEPPLDPATRRLRRNLKPLWYVLLVLWEGYWIAEVVERFARPNPFQLPYFFLLVMMVGVPLAVYLLARRRVRAA